MENVTYSINAETLNNLEFICEFRPGVSKSLLVRELIAIEAKRIREKLKDTGTDAIAVHKEIRSVREKLIA